MSRYRRCAAGAGEGFGLKAGVDFHYTFRVRGLRLRGERSWLVRGGVRDGMVTTFPTFGAADAL
jgi:hypothetical protein